MIRLFKVFIPTSVVALLITETILTFCCFLLASYLVVAPDYDIQMFLFDDRGLARIGAAVAIIILGLYLNDLYTDVRLQSRIRLLQQLCLILGVAFIAQALFGYLRLNLVLSKWVLIVGGLIAMPVLLVGRIVFSATLSKATGLQKILFLGSSPVVFEVGQHLAENPQLGWQPLGYLAEPTADGLAPDKVGNTSLTCLGWTGDLTNVMKEFRPNRLVVAMKERRQRLPIYELLELRFSGVHTEEIASLYEIAFGKVCTREIRPSQLIFSNVLGPQPQTLRIQSLYSFILAFIGATLTLPVMAIVAILIKITSPGPVLFRQTRVGLHNKTFQIFKFRSMRHDAESRTGAVWAKRNDPRVTMLGHWLRKLRLDELPQFFNVLRGEMVIVGPRPERPEFVQSLSEQIPFYSQRHCVKPGITGWAQINYKYGETIEDTIVKLEYDLYYIKHLSTSLDLYIMFHTVKTMMLSRGSQ